MARTGYVINIYKPLLIQTGAVFIHLTPFHIKSTGKTKTTRTPFLQGFWWFTLTITREGTGRLSVVLIQSYICINSMFKVKYVWLKSFFYHNHTAFLAKTYTIFFDNHISLIKQPCIIMFVFYLL